MGDEFDEIATDVLERSEVRCPYRRELLIADIAAAIRTAIAADRQRVSGAVRAFFRSYQEPCAECEKPSFWFDVNGVSADGEACQVDYFCEEHKLPTSEIMVPDESALRTLLALLDGDDDRAAADHHEGAEGR